MNDAENYFRTLPDMKDLLRQCFVQFRCELAEEKLIDQEAIFIDGTKIEADANKLTFVWKKSTWKVESALQSTARIEDYSRNYS